MLLDESDPKVIRYLIFNKKKYIINELILIKYFKGFVCKMPYYLTKTDKE